MYGQTRRNAFTLIELLVVLAIIAILVGLLAAGVMNTLGQVPKVQTRVEISQLEVALRAFMSDYGLDYPPPSKLTLRETQIYNSDDTTPGGELATYRFLIRCFGRNHGAVCYSFSNPPNPLPKSVACDWNGDGIIQANTCVLGGERCLIFYIGGIPNIMAMNQQNAQPGCLGFSTYSVNPSTSLGSRKGPYFDFKSSRLVTGTAGGFYFYRDAYKPKNGNPMPYVYFSSQGNLSGYNPLDCASVTCYDQSGAAHIPLPYWEAQNATGVPTQYTNNKTFQILSAGEDGVFGFNGNFKQPNNLWNPSQGAQGYGADDQANFAAKILGAGQ